jgi:hypothetical protein
MTFILGNPRWRANYGADAMALVLTKPPQTTGKLMVFPNINLFYQVPLKTCHKRAYLVITAAGAIYIYFIVSRTESVWVDSAGKFSRTDFFGLTTFVLPVTTIRW